MTSTLRARRSLVILLLLAAALPAPATAAIAPVAVAASSSAAAAPAPLAPTTFARRLSGEVYGYLPYWELDSGTDAYLRYDLLTDIAMFSVGLTSSGTIATSLSGYASVTGSTAATIVSHAHAAGVRVDLTVTSFGFTKNAAFFTNPAAMATAAAAISSLARAKGFDGVSLDVELLDNPYFAAYGTFVGQIRDALRTWNPAARVNVAVNGSVSGAGMALQGLKNGADRVFIMGYSYRTSGSTPAGSIAPLVRPNDAKSLTWTLDTFAQKGVPASAIILGLPYYGRSWHTTSDALNATATSSAGVFIPSDDWAAVPSGTPIQYDATEGTKWFAVKDASGWTETYFDDGATLRRKYSMASSRGLAGIGIWTLGYDRGVGGYWDAISASFGTIRLGGADRYATAAAIVDEAFGPGTDTVFIASGAGFADAVAGAAAAGANGSPLLLVTPTGIPASTAAALTRLGPAHIVVVGGPASVSDDVVKQLSGLATSGATRLGGVDRYGTAAAVSAALHPDGAAVVYLASGIGFADAVSAAPAAARDHAPLLLTRTASVPATTMQELVRLAPAKLVVVGGVAAVSDAAVEAVRAAVPGIEVVRLQGPDRYVTSAAVAATYAPGVAAVYVASGAGFSDALAAAAVAGARGVPMLLTTPEALPSAVSWHIGRLNPARAIVAGGRSAVSDLVLDAVRSAVAR